MTIIAKQYNEIFNKYYYKNYSGGSSSDVIVSQEDTAFNLDSDARLGVLTEIMYRKSFSRDELPESYVDDLDAFGYTMNGMLEWTVAKITTLTDEFVDIDGTDSKYHPQYMKVKMEMMTELMQDVVVYRTISALTVLENNYLKQLGLSA